jgi:Tfp pilus assembly protein PilF
MSTTIGVQNRANYALALLQRAQERHPNNYLTSYHTGLFYQHQKDTAKSIEYFIKAHNMSPTSTDVIVSLANAYRQLGQSDTAEVHYFNASQQQPRNAHILANYGAILHLNKKYAAAKIVYENALLLDKNDAITRENLIKLNRLLADENVKM